MGVSGSPNGRNGLSDFSEKLQNALNESAGYDKYTVSPVVDGDLLEQIVKPETKTAKPDGVCAEPKAATAAHYNDSTITGMDVRYFGENALDAYLLPNASSSNQMGPCDTCNKNEEVYMNYANGRK